MKLSPYFYVGLLIMVITIIMITLHLTVKPEQTAQPKVPADTTVVAYPVKNGVVVPPRVTVFEGLVIAPPTVVWDNYQAVAKTAIGVMTDDHGVVTIVLDDQDAVALRSYGIGDTIDDRNNGWYFYKGLTVHLAENGDSLRGGIGYRLVP